MKENLAGREGADTSPTLGVEWPPAGRAGGGRLTGRVTAGVRRIAADLGDQGVRIALALAACIGALAILAAIHGIVTPIPPFDLRSEVDLGEPLAEAIAIPAMFSGLLLFAAAAFAIAAGEASERFPWLAIAVFLAFMGVDEVAGIHERVGSFVMGADNGSNWEIPYIPVLLLGGFLWLSTLQRMWSFVSERALWLGGAFAWILAQGIEEVVNHRDASSSLLGSLHLQALTFSGNLFDVLDRVEEIVEMAGSSMFLLALYLAWRRLAAGRAELGSHHARA
jgi:hypothetical protein